MKFVVSGLLALSMFFASQANASNGAEQTAQFGSFDQCRDYLPGGKAPSLNLQPGGLAAICYEGFAVLYSGHTKTALYSVSKLNREKLSAASEIPREDNFFEDARVPAQMRARLEDYRGSGMDRGHIHPAADSFTENGKAQSFSLLNIAPQFKDHNQKLWRKIEMDTRKYILRSSGDVYVITGVAFMGERRTIGRGQVWVPSHFYKAVIHPQAGKSWAIWTDHANEGVKIERISLQELEARVGLRVGG